MLEPSLIKYHLITNLNFIKVYFINSEYIEKCFSRNYKRYQVFSNIEKKDFVLYSQLDNPLHQHVILDCFSF